MTKRSKFGRFLQAVMATPVEAALMIVDDISPHQAFANFAQDFPSLETVVCPHSDRAGSCFGIVHKPASSQPA